jgi:hypothetical protein
MPLKNWSVVANDNDDSPPNGFPESMTIANLNNSARQVMADVRTLAAADTIASATTCDLGTKDATFLTVSGTTTITGLGTVSAGIYKFVVFSGALTLTHNGTSLILPGAANITTVAGDTGLFLSLGSGNWRCMYFQPVTATSYQPLDSDLTAIAALTTTATGRSLLAIADAAAGRTILGVVNTSFSSSAENAAGTIEDKAVDPLGIREALNATGTAPVYACRAWINFDGTGTPAERASGNVSSITDGGNGNWRINFSTALPDADYSVVVTSNALPGTRNILGFYREVSTTGYVDVGCMSLTGTASDCTHMNVAIFR